MQDTEKIWTHEEENLSSWTQRNLYGSVFFMREIFDEAGSDSHDSAPRYSYAYAVSQLQCTGLYTGSYWYRDVVPPIGLLEVNCIYTSSQSANLQTSGAATVTETLTKRKFYFA